jgi:hypothetical protein
MTLCPNAHLSLITNLALEHGLGEYKTPHEAFEDIAAQNLVGDGASGYKPFYEPFEYMKDVSASGLLPVQVIRLVIDYQEACEPNPTWEGSPAKQITDKLLRIYSKKLEGYLAPSPFNTVEGILANKAELWRQKP